MLPKALTFAKVGLGLLGAAGRQTSPICGALTCLQGRRAQCQGWRCRGPGSLWGAVGETPRETEEKPSGLTSRWPFPESAGGRPNLTGSGTFTVAVRGQTT